MKIGIIGTESTHARAFAEICEGYHIETVTDNFLKAEGDLDGVMIVTRDGNTHKNLAMPFVEAGIPLWIDKPIAVRADEAEELLSVARTKGCLVTGGSTCKFAPDILSLAEKVQSGAFGEIRSAMLNFPIMLDSPYNGIHFYGHHLAEMMLTVFGYTMRKVMAFEKNGGIVCIARYDRFDAVMNFQPGVMGYYATVLGTKAQIARPLDLSAIYQNGVDAYLQMLKTKKEPVSHQNLIFPVKLVGAIEKSYMENREISL